MKNQVIKNLTPEMGREIIKYWQSRGVDTGDFEGNHHVSAHSQWIYYGVINDIFGVYPLRQVQDANAEIIELPKQNQYPKVMMVSDSPLDDENAGVQRVVFMEKLGKYLAWNEAETIEDAEGHIGINYWEYAVDIEQPKEEDNSIELTIKTLEEGIDKLKKLINKP
jgi:hypothetical protein